MDSRNIRRKRSGAARLSRGLLLMLTAVCIAAAGVTVMVYEKGRPSDSPAASVPKPAPAPAAPKLSIVDFHMDDLEHGWIRYADKTVTTGDGGLHWQEDGTGTAAADPGSASSPAWNGWLSDDQPPAAASSIEMDSRTYPVKKTQFLTDRIGWALLSGEEESDDLLAVTDDGGHSWKSQVTPEIQSAIQEEQQRLQRTEKEASLYATPELAKSAIRSGWTLIPNTASPGDVVLVRHNQPGEVQWQGKTYPLQPFGAGYFTYLPIPMQAKLGEYPIGDQILKIQAKKFDTQYLQVTKEMEAMRQDTKRIAADQRKIDLARSRSQPEFLFTSDFVQPIEGILTTPFGFTRYVNGKLDSSHMAIDLAAEQGTPIRATNDGIVALADNLYLTGNSIYIDHGMGLFSQYAHMSELKVKTGDRVKKSDIIGLVGTTGFSTGPHLHFTFWAHNVPVNPNLFFNTTPFHWMAKKTE